MGSHAITPEELKRLRNSMRSSSDSSSSNYSYIKEEEQRFETNKQEFINDILGKQTDKDKNAIAKLNQKESSLNRIGLVTSGKINKQNVYLSIDENANLIYDIVSSNKCLSMLVEKEFASSNSIDYTLNLVNKGNQLQLLSKRFYDYDMKDKYYQYMPKDIVKNVSYLSLYDYTDKERNKLLKFVNTYLFAGTDLNTTKVELDKEKERREKLKEIQFEMEQKKLEKAIKEEQKKIKQEQKSRSEFVSNYSIESSFWQKLANKVKGGFFK